MSNKIIYPILIVIFLIALSVCVYALIEVYPQEVSTYDEFPGIEDKKQIVPIGTEEGVDKIKENPEPSEGPGEEDQ